MGCSVFVTQDQEILHKTFRVTTEYMPKEAQDLAVTDAFTHSIQWSRRFIGLKLYLSVLTFGWRGYQQLIEHTLSMKDHLIQLLEPQWKITNQSELPIVCCVPREQNVDVAQICQQVVSSGKAWISVYPVNGVPSLRICITNYQTNEQHLKQLVDLLNQFLKS
jgi:glutamate/tyrosine decarboxylase-like PLP-dependent enzyme